MTKTFEETTSAIQGSKNESLITANQADDDSNYSSVIIIGSGISGVKCAVDLTNKNIDVRMLEAQDHVGGRLKTYRDDEGRHYDLGASWLHDTLQNELFEHAIDLGCKLYYDDGDWGWYTNQGERIPNSLKAQRVVFDAEHKIQLAYEDLTLPDKSLKEFTEEFVQTHPLITEEQKVLAPQMMRYLELWHAIPWDRVSAKYGIPEHFGRDAFVTSGYDKIFTSVYEQIDRTNLKLHLNSEVINISRANDKERLYTVKTKSGETYTSKYVLVTIPAGALKYTHQDLFAPNLLPKPLETVIHEMELAALGKFVLEFESVFWPEDLDNMVSLGNDALKSLTPGAHPLVFTNGKPLFGRNCLLALTSPPLTHYLEANPDKVYDFFEPALKGFRVDKSKPLPKMTFLLATDWTQNKYFRASYSALLVGQDYYNNILPFIDGADRLRFAGEHTTHDANGCVQGAYATGRREAEYILADMKGDALPYKIRESLENVNLNGK
ncbi:polyamine oxidase [Sugiyamaella lignohabitans]|uniref:Polyamine oxidase n=1 Tax=Sugiyamaella lignohabitans TaxID=796027 RepID=A0A167CVG5_9ASCO|nr:polyamine oxidase [Sugiyamaella lignohabitans]ANB12152.1 polyamine oxidase [Sugiyamaella lignohabitans]